jgi:3-oxoacyl-[acyl-carrier protein] reductase
VNTNEFGCIPNPPKFDILKNIYAGGHPPRVMSIALVSGGSGGIGQAICKKLSNSNDVVIHYNSDESSAEQLAEEINQSGNSTAIPYQCDLSDPNAIEEMIKNVRADLGKINILVNNAGIGTGHTITESSTEYIEQMLAINLKGTMYLTKVILPDMFNEQNSHIVNVASSAGIHGSRRDPTYGASKGGMIAFSKSLARAYTADGIFCNVVAPGPTDTKMYPTDNIPNAEKNMRIGRLLRPEEIATAVEFFTQTTSISGKVLEVDGGRDI